MAKLIDKELQEFWEWCGFKLVMAVDKKTLWSMRLWINPLTNKGGSYPDLDLNNLFEYAVPKLALIMGAEEFAKFALKMVVKLFLDKDPALALYQAIQKARKVE